LLKRFPVIQCFILISEDEIDEGMDVK
jgi:hypothetical protein